jgi:hypothetical protein
LKPSEKKVKLDLFRDIIRTVLIDKKDVTQDASFENVYAPWVVNRSISFHYDCIMHANQMNMNSHLDKKMQFDYYLNSIRSYKRPFQQWQKQEIVENLSAIAEYYNFSNEKAKEALSILTEDQISAIKQRLDKGGLDHARNKGTNRGKAKRT